MKWTKEQQAAIDIRDKNILVSAAAGSGKTAVLVERIKQLIIEDGIPIDKMLVVTFSNAAASEMREKILEAITKEIELQNLREDGGVKSAFLRQQLHNIHKANISTFHAFSMEVIRRYFYLIDVEPNFKICDEAQKTILQAEAMEQLFTDLFQSKSEDFFVFLNKYSISKNENSVKDMIFESHSFIQSIPDSFAWLKREMGILSQTKEDFLKSPPFKEMKGDIERGLATAHKYFLKVGELLENQQISSLVLKCNQDIASLEQAEGQLENDFDEFAAAMRTMKFQVFSVSKTEKESYEEIKEDVTAYRDKGKNIIKRLISLYLTKSMDESIQELNDTYNEAQYLYFLVERFNDIYRLKKQEKGLIDFNDIEHYALDILSHEEAAREYQQKFEAIFIDEYQDSNMVQETLIDKIKRENNLFMVGDVKQSIYKFRLAEPEIFIDKYEKFKEAGNHYDLKVDLNRNFRSKGNVIKGVNDIFSQIMRKDFSGLDYDEAAALYKGIDYEGDLDYPLELHLLDDMQLEDPDIDDEIREMKKIEIEAYTAARIIKEARGREIYDVKKNQKRGLANKDIVILLREVRSSGPIYYEALMREGIPAFVDNSDGYFDSVEIEVFLNLIRIIDNKKQDIPLLSILRSPVFGFTIEDLIKIRLNSRKTSYYKAFQDYSSSGDDEELKDKCQGTISKINRWKKESSFMVLEDFLWKLIRDTGYYQFIGAIPGGVQRQANLRALIDKAVQFQSNQMKGLFSFINYIEAIKKRKVPMGQVKLLGENDDVVRIMTIHKSKGLEFPMVLLGGLGKKFNKDRGSYKVTMHKDLGIAIRLADEDDFSYKKTLLHKIIEQKKNKENLAEEIRILYVGFTRAMDKLVLLGSLTNIEKAFDAYRLKDNEDLLAGNSYLDFIIPALKSTDIMSIHHNRGDLNLVKEETETQREKVRDFILESRHSLLEDGKLEEEAQNDELREEIERRLSFKYRHSKALNLKSKFTVSELNKLGRGEWNDSSRSLTLSAPKFSQGKKDFTGAEKGTILHKVMEHIDFRKFEMLREEEADLRNPAAYIESFINSLLEREILTEEEVKAVNINKIINFLNSPIGKRASKATAIFKEVSFNIRKELQGENIILQGTIDCYFKEDGRYILLDYKSDYLPNKDLDLEIKDLVENYKSQLNLYKEALEKIRNIKVEECYLYLFHIDRAIKV